MDLSSSSSSPLQDDLMNTDMIFWSLSLEPFDLDLTAPSLALPPLEPPLPVVPRSAFVRYVRPETGVSSDCSSAWVSNERNIHRRVIGFLRRIPRERPEENRMVGGGGECSRGFRHMMRERQRRERLSQSYADLRSMLPYISKTDKNSIIQSTAMYVRELQGVKEELVRRNEEFKLRIAGNSNPEGSKIKLRMAYPTSTLDSMIGALQCLKAMDAKVRAIHTEFSDHELTAVMTIESKVGASEVERALEMRRRETTI